MKTKLKIKKKSTSQVTTKYGPKDKHSFLLVSSKGEFWASCFANQITGDWQEGETREMELEQNGKYWNIVVPKAPPLADSIARLEEKVDRILGILLNNAPEGQNEAELPPDIDDQGSEPPPDDIPF